MNLNIAQTVRAQLGDEPIKADVIAERLQMKREVVYQALVWLYDQGMARLAITHRNKTVRGWEAL